MGTTSKRMLVVLAAGLLLVGCLGRARPPRGGDDDDDDDAVPTAGDDADDGEPDGETDGDPVPPPEAEDPPAEDPDPEPVDPPDEPPIDERGAYPSGPFGVWNGDTMANYTFLTGSGTIRLEDVRRDASHDILLLYLGSASCAYCGTETPELNTLYEADEPRGLEIFGVLSDDGGGPPTGASADAYFGDQHGAQYPYGANEWAAGTLMTDLYPDGNVALPMNFIIDLESMEILERMDGYPDQGGLAPIVESYLGG
jgi:peroxiredoxin